jgi:hypothetical protein
MGIIVPNETRFDLLTMQAFSYDLFAQVKPITIVFLLPAPNDYTLTGLALPSLETLDTNLGDFNIDTMLTTRIFSSQLPVKVENNYFTPNLPRLLETQLAFLKFMANGQTGRFRIVPILVRFDDMNAQSKDSAPVLADLIVKNADWPDAAEATKRLRNLVPPQAMRDPNAPPPNPMDDPMARAELAGKFATAHKTMADANKTSMDTLAAYGVMLPPVPPPLPPEIPQPEPHPAMVGMPMPPPPPEGGGSPGGSQPPPY